MLKVQFSIPDLKAQVLALRQKAQDPMAAPVNSELLAEAELRRQESVRERTVSNSTVSASMMRTAVGNTYFAFSRTGTQWRPAGTSRGLRARTSTPLPPTWTGGDGC